MTETKTFDVLMRGCPEGDILHPMFQGLARPWEVPASALEPFEGTEAWVAATIAYRLDERGEALYLSATHWGPGTNKLVVQLETRRLDLLVRCLDAALIPVYEC